MKRNQIAAICFGIFALILFFGQKRKENDVVVMNEPTHSIEIVLKDDLNHLIPLTVKSMCSTELECLNESLSLCSKDYPELQKTLPVQAEVLSLECDEICRIDFSKETFEVEPARVLQVEQTLGYLLKNYPDAEITVEGKQASFLKKRNSDYLNSTYFIDEDYHRGSLYQMFMVKEIQNQMVSVPVVIYSKETDPLKVIESYYGLTTAVQYDNMAYQQVEIVDGEPLTVRLSKECMMNQQLNDALVLPILYSLKEHTDAASVLVEVEKVAVKEVSLNDLRINEFHLSD